MTRSVRGKIGFICMNSQIPKFICRFLMRERKKFFFYYVALLTIDKKMFYRWTKSQHEQKNIFFSLMYSCAFRNGNLGIGGLLCPPYY